MMELIEELALKSKNELDNLHNELQDYTQSKIDILFHVFTHPKTTKIIECEICFARFGTTVFCPICSFDNYKIGMEFHLQHGILTMELVPRSFVTSTLVSTTQQTSVNFKSGKQI